MSLHWLKTRWRTRGEYASTARHLVTRFGCALAMPLLVIAAVLGGLFWVLSGPSRAGERAQRIDELAERIVAAVERGLPAGPSAPAELDDLVAAGVLTAADVAFLAAEGVTYQPLHRAAPDTAAVFRRTAGGVERVHRKNGTEDYYTSAVSPDGRHQVVVGPPAPGMGPAARGMRSVTLRTVATGGTTARVLATLTVPDFAEAHWSPDGRFVAIEARPADPGGASAGSGQPRATDLETFVLAVGPSGVRRLDLPAGIRPEALLAPGDRGARLQAASVRVLAWRGDMLVVVSEGTGWLGPPGEATSRYVSVRCRVTLELATSAVRELERRC